MSNFVSTPEQWDRYVEEYAKMPTQGDLLAARLFGLAEPLRPLSTATAILDDGCGTGVVIAKLMRDHGDELPTSVRLIASDYSKGMVEYVTKLKELPENVSNPLWQRLETYTLDAQDLSPSIAPASLSHIFSNLVFMAIKDCAKPIQTAYESLEEGGILAFSMLVRIEWVEIWMYAKDEIDPDGDWDLSVAEGWRSQDSVERLVKEAGFTTIQLERQELPMRHTPETLAPFVASFLQSSNPLAANIFRGLSPEKLQRAVDLIVQGVVKEQGESIVLKGMLQYVVATK